MWGAPNGERWDYHVGHLGRIAVALIVDSLDRVLMLWRYRFVTEQWGYELLGDLMDEGEDAATTAAREVEEESGWRPVGELVRLVSFEPLPGQVTAPVDWPISIRVTSTKPWSVTGKPWCRSPSWETNMVRRTPGPASRGYISTSATRRPHSRILAWPWTPTGGRGAPVTK